MKGEPRDGTNRRHEPRPQRPGWVAVVEACGAWRRIGGRAGCNCFGHAPIWACFIAHGKPKLHIKWADAPRCRSCRAKSRQPSGKSKVDGHLDFARCERVKTPETTSSPTPWSPHLDRKSKRLNYSNSCASRMPTTA